MKRQFVSTCYIVNNEGKFLLLFHTKHQKWLPPGGHVEEDETPSEAAEREVFEETGLKISFLLQENLWVNEWNAKSLPRPYSCLLEGIPERKGEPAHEHIDFIFVARVVSGEPTDGRWFTLDEVEGLKTHEEVFFDTQETVRKLAQSRDLQLIP